MNLVWNPFQVSRDGDSSKIIYFSNDFFFLSNAIMDASSDLSDFAVLDQF